MIITPQNGQKQVVCDAPHGAHVGALVPVVGDGYVVVARLAQVLAHYLAPANGYILERALQFLRYGHLELDLDDAHHIQQPKLALV